MADTKIIDVTKTTGRIAVIGAIGVIVAYVLKQVFPTIPAEVTAAIITLIGVAYDRAAYLINSKYKVPF